MVNRIFPILIMAIGINSCASMFGNNGREISVNSSPQGATIFLNGIQYGETPRIITLPTYIYGNQTLTLKKTGYEDQSTSLNSEFQLVGLWNILNFPWGTIIDAADGDMVKISRHNLNTITLTPIQSLKKIRTLI